MAKQGKIGLDNYVWNPTLKVWMYAKDVAEIAKSLGEKESTAKGQHVQPVWPATRYCRHSSVCFRKSRFRCGFHFAWPCVFDPLLHNKAMTFTTHFSASDTTALRALKTVVTAMSSLG